MTLKIFEADLVIYSFVFRSIKLLNSQYNLPLTLLRNFAIIAIMFGMKRRSYKIDTIIVNGKAFSEVIIDPHYEENHSEHISSSS